MDINKLLRDIAYPNLSSGESICLVPSSVARYAFPHFDTERHSCAGLTHATLGVASYKWRKSCGCYRTPKDFVTVIDSGRWLSETGYAGVAVHEISHYLAALYPPPSIAEYSHYQKTRQLGEWMRRWNLSRKEAHDGRFLRCLSHAWGRAKLAGSDLPLAVLVPGVGNFREMVSSLNNEIVQSIGQPLGQVLDSPMPDTFARLVGQAGHGYLTRATRELPGPTVPVTAPPTAPRPQKPTHPTPARPSAEWQARVRKAMAKTADSPYESSVIHV